MRIIKYFLIVQVVFIFSISYIFNHAHAIIIVGPAILGLVQVILWIIGISSVPATFIAAILHLEKYKESKIKFLLLVIITWIAILGVIAGLSVAIIKIFNIHISIGK